MNHRRSLRRVAKRELWQQKHGWPVGTVFRVALQCRRLVAIDYCYHRWRRLGAKWQRAHL